MIIGITGTNGAGKGEVVRRLVDKYGFVHFSARELLTQEVKRRGLMIDRQSLIDMGNELRQLYGPDFVIGELCQRAVIVGENSVIESLRTVGEVNRLKSNGGKLWAVDADVEIRYKRILKRRGLTDNVTFVEFVASEGRERWSLDPNRQNLDGCISWADFVIENNGTKKQLYAKVDRELKKLGLRK